MYLTLLPFAGLAVFVGTTCGLLTIDETSFVSTSSTVALFVIVFVYFPVSISSTVTWKLRVVCPLSGTFTSMPAFRFSFVWSSLLSSFTFILPSTNVVPSGASSFIITSFAKSPSFVTVIVYVIFSPSVTYDKLFSVFIDFLAEIIGSI